MKLRRLLLCLFAVIALCGTTAVNALAAETDTAASATEATTKEDLTDTAETAADTQTAEAVADTQTAEAVEDSQAAAVTEDTQAVEAEEKTEEKEEKKTEVSKKKEATAKKASYTKAELRLLACLISCEAGSEPYAGKLAVGIVVMNRKESSRFPDTLKGVIYQKYQFGPARNGSLKAALSRYDSGKFTSSSDKACIKAAKEALSGEKMVSYKGKEINMKSFLFFSGKVSGARLTIGNHQFK